MKLVPPHPLDAGHDLTQFACGEASLDDWLKKRAQPNQLQGASRTFVVVDAQNRVLGYSALATGAISRHLATGSVRRNMPDPIPVIILGRLAVDMRFQGFKLGAGLLQDAVLRTMTIAQHAGVRAILAHALHERAKHFYEYYGFRISPLHPLTLMLPIA